MTSPGRLDHVATASFVMISSGATLPSRTASNWICAVEPAGNEFHVALTIPAASAECGRRRGQPRMRQAAVKDKTCRKGIDEGDFKCVGVTGRGVPQVECHDKGIGRLARRWGDRLLRCQFGSTTTKLGRDAPGYPRPAKPASSPTHRHGHMAGSFSATAR